MHDVASGIETLNGDPRRVRGELIVNCRSASQMMDAGFLQILRGGGVFARGLLQHQFLRLLGSYAEIQDELFAWQSIDGIFDVADPVDEGAAVFWQRARALMREIGADVAIGED